MVQVDGVNMEVRVCFSMAAILPSVRLYFLINFHTSFCLLMKNGTTGARVQLIIQSCRAGVNVDVETLK